MKTLFLMSFFLSSFANAEDRSTHDHASPPRTTHSHDLTSQTAKPKPHDPSAEVLARKHSHGGSSDGPTSCAAHAHVAGSLDEIAKEAKPDFKPIDARGFLAGADAAAGEVFYYDPSEDRVLINRPAAGPHDDYYALLGKSAWERMNRRLSFRCGREGIKYRQVREKSEKAFDLALGKALFVLPKASKPEGSADFVRALVSASSALASPTPVARK